MRNLIVGLIFMLVLIFCYLDAVKKAEKTGSKMWLLYLFCVVFVTVMLVYNLFLLYY